MSFLKKIIYRNLYVVLLAGLFFSAQKPPAREYQIKAVFLFNFTQFVEWPSSSFPSKPATAYPSAPSPMIIGIFGEDPFGSYLEETVSGEKVNGHPLVIQRYRTIEEIKNCHILFINASESAKMDQISARLKTNNTLTVSDASNFIQAGGMIRFFTVNNKIQFQINPDEAKAAGLTISSKLLRLAEIVIPKKNKK